RIYKQKAAQIHPRKLNDPETTVKELNSLFNEIKKRFGYKLGLKVLKKYIKRQRKEKLVSCLCGCNQTFYQTDKGIRTRHFYNKKCNNRYYRKLCLKI
ncbi:MAG: hypothetical protein AABY22_19215, partial [Nanoarchaeota archaeon]